MDALRRTRAHAVVVSLLSAASGCYRYTAVSPGTVAAPSDVRMTLTSAGAAALVPVLGRSTAAVEGRVLRGTDSIYVIAVSSTLKRDEDDSTSLVRTVWAG